MKLPNFLNFNFTKFISLIVTLLLLSQCGLYKKTDSRKIPVNANERVKKNLEEGKRLSFSQLTNRGSGTFEFASSNEMWRATIDVLDFIPLSNADYGGGVIITDWYTETENNDSIKIMVQFLSNDVRADGLKIVVYNKTCSVQNPNNCTTNIDEGNISGELKLAILKKAAIYKTENTNKVIKKNKNKLTGLPK